MKASFKDRSDGMSKHVCDFCGKESEHLWEGLGIEGQYCFAHYREMHEDIPAFDAWCKEFKEYLGENK